ncbi:right-handed parallel beta-helix repeat-containing protein, partial [Enterobacter hormaechei]
DGGGGTTGSGLIWEGANTRDGGAVEQCEFKYIGGAGIRISGDYTNRVFARYAAIRNCRFIKCGNTGIANDRASVIADGVNNFTFDGLIMTECNWGLYVRMDTQLADKARAPNNLIQNCHIFGSGQTHPTFIDAQGLSANRQDSLKVDNCWIGDFRDNGFDCGSSTGTQITNFRVNNCKDAIFIGDIDCDSYVIDNVVARDCERGVRIVMDGNIQSDGIVRNVRITNMLVTNPKYQGLYIGNTGANTGVFDIYLANVYVDSVSSWSLSSFTRPFHIEGIDGIFMDNCGTRYAKTHSVYFKKCDQAQLRGGRFQESDQSGGGTYAITVENDCARVSISDAIVYGKSTTGAVLLAGGAGHSVKHIRWRSAANGVSSSSATTPYLLDNMAF